MAGVVTTVTDTAGVVTNDTAGVVTTVTDTAGVVTNDTAGVVTTVIDTAGEMWQVQRRKQARDGQGGM